MKYFIIEVVLFFIYYLMLIFRDQIPFGTISETLLINDYILFNFFIGLLNLFFCYKKNKLSIYTWLCLILMIILIYFILNTLHKFRTV